MRAARVVVVLSLAGAQALAACGEDDGSGGTKGSTAGGSATGNGQAGEGGSSGVGEAGTSGTGGAGANPGKGGNGTGDATSSAGQGAEAGAGASNVGGSGGMGGDGRGGAGSDDAGGSGVAGEGGVAALCPRPLDMPDTSTPIPSPALYYRFEDADVTGNVLSDSSGNDLDATIEAGITAGVDGVVGHAFEFDGATGSMTLSPATSLKVSPITVSAWINVPPNRADRGVFVNLGNGSASWTGWAMEARLADEVMWVTQGGTSVQQLIAVGCVEPARWMHFVGVFDGALTTLYRDGVYQAVTPVDYATIPYGTLPLVFGHHSLFLNRYFEGKLDEFAIWTRDLTSAEVYAVYVAGLSGLPLVQ